MTESILNAQRKSAANCLDLEGFLWSLHFPDTHSRTNGCAFLWPCNSRCGLNLVKIVITLLHQQRSCFPEFLCDLWLQFPYKVTVFTISLWSLANSLVKFWDLFIPNSSSSDFWLYCLMPGHVLTLACSVGTISKSFLLHILNLLLSLAHYK